MLLKDIDITGYSTILLDRDGPLNRQRQGDYVKCWEEFEFLPEVLNTLARFALTAKYIFVVTNQRGVGKGYMTEQQLSDIHSQMISEIEAVGGRIDKVYYSDGVSDEDLTRKPNVGMWQQICLDYPDINVATTLMIGDGDCDMAFAHNCGIDFIKVDRQQVVFIKETTD